MKETVKFSDFYNSFVVVENVDDIRVSRGVCVSRCVHLSKGLLRYHHPNLKGLLPLMLFSIRLAGVNVTQAEGQGIETSVRISSPKI